MASTVLVPPQPKSLLLDAIRRLAGLDNAPVLPVSDHVVLSSQKCAAARAIDTESASPLAADPYARLLAGAQYDAACARRQQLHQRPRIAIRTRYFDAYLASCLGQLPTAQLVMLGAGMDSRVYRLPAIAPRHSVFEVDVKACFDVKAHLLSLLQPEPVPRCALRRVATDLSKPRWMDALLDAGFNPKRPTVWLLEGLVYYQDEVRVSKLLREVRVLSAPASCIGLSAVTRVGDSRRFVSSMMDPIVSLSNAGFNSCYVDILGGPNANYGRWPVPAPKAPQEKAKAGGDSCRGATMFVRASVADAE